VTATDPPAYKRSLLRQERSLNTRRAILQAALRLLGEQDFESITVEDICVNAGVGRSTFYLYFSTKDELLIALARATARGVSNDVDSWINAGSIDESLRIFIDALVRRMESVPKTLAVLVMRRVSVANVSPRPVPGDPVLFDDILGGIVREGQRRGDVRSDLDAGDIGEAMAGMTLDALQRWAGGQQRRTLRRTLELQFRLVLEGVRASDHSRSTER
jgi:AcrR family transcriptional regulator